VPELRFNRLRDEWVAYSTVRNDRTFLPSGDSCPLCPSGPGGKSEVPLDDYEVVVFENRFPALGPDPDEHGRPVRPPTSGCEVVVYTPDHHATLADLPLERVRLLVDVWADRYLALGSRPEVAYVYEFENKGEIIGVTLHHPHGQIYALPFVPPVPATELAQAERYRHATGNCLHCDLLAAECGGPRLVFEAGGMAAFVPEAARWPYEVHLYPLQHRASLATLDHGEREAFAAALLRVARAYDRHFGFSTPYVMAIHQAPVSSGGPAAAMGSARSGSGRGTVPPEPPGDSSEWPDAHLHVEFYPPHRRPDRLKYLAGVELGAGTFVNDTAPEQTAADLREAVER